MVREGACQYQILGALARACTTRIFARVPRNFPRRLPRETRSFAVPPIAEAGMSFLAYRSRALSSAAFALLASVIGATPLLAQQAGTVRGAVKDSATSVAVPGASIIVVGTRLGATTDAEGRYVIRGVTAGQQSLRLT